MLRGLPFFQRFIGFVEKYNTKRIPTFFTLQTNGTLMDREWAAFFGRNHFLIGLSIDGSRSIHDAYRLDNSGSGTFDRVIRAAELLQKGRVDFNILCVVTEEIAKNGKKVYHDFKSRGFRYLQFIPCLDSLGEEPGSNPFSLQPETYGQFLIELFREWSSDLRRGDYTSIRLFDNLVLMMKGEQPEACDLRGECARGTVLEADGSMYPCDFYVMPEWKMGNILQDDFPELLSAANAVEFVASSHQIDPQCKTCRFYPYCRSGCRRHKEPAVPGQPLKNIFCKSYQMFYSSALPELKRLASLIR